MEYFIRASSLSAPFFPDISTEFINAQSAEDALSKFASTYSHPAGLQRAECYRSADEFSQGREPLAKWPMTSSSSESETALSS